MELSPHCATDSCHHTIAGTIRLLGRRVQALEGCTGSGLYFSRAEEITHE